jgi:Zn-dependent oligopeptidase
MSAFPDWAAFTPEKAAEELPRLLDGAEAAVAAIESAAPQKYEDFIWALDDATDSLWHCWGAVSHMLSVMNDEAWRKVQEDFQGRIVGFSLRVGQSKRLYEIAKSLLADAGLSSERRRILEIYPRQAHFCIKVLHKNTAVISVIADALVIEEVEKQVVKRKIRAAGQNSVHISR